jgi:hypothetical protein
MATAIPNPSFQTAMSVLSHVYFAPILGALIRAKVPDLLNGGAVESTELSNRAGLQPLSTLRALRTETHKLIENSGGSNDLALAASPT